MSLDQNDPNYSPPPGSSKRAEEKALREAIAEQIARNQGVQPQIDAIATILSAMKPEIEKIRLLRGQFPMKVDGNIISIDESAINGGGADGIAENFDCWQNGALVIKRLLVV
jgi:hypothetical protein